MAALEERNRAVENELEIARRAHAAETEETWQEIKRIASVPQPLAPPDLKAYTALQEKCMQLETLVHKLQEDNYRIKGAGILQKIGTPELRALNSPPMGTLKTPSSSGYLSALNSPALHSTLPSSCMSGHVEVAHADDAEVQQELSIVLRLQQDVLRLQDALRDAYAKVFCFDAHACLLLLP